MKQYFLVAAVACACRNGFDSPSRLRSACRSRIRGLSTRWSPTESHCIMPSRWRFV